MNLSIQSVDLDVEREPLVRPFGFKGGFFSEKWLCRSTLESTSGFRAQGLGGLAVLWSDPDVFAAHTEAGGNLVMAAMLESALQAAVGKTFAKPPELLGELVDPVFEYGKHVTGRPVLRKTFVYNSLVSLDNAAWVLYAREQGFGTFDEMIPEAYRVALGHRHDRVVSVPAVSYGTPLEDVRRLVESGCSVLKIKLGSPGDPGERIEKDKERLAAIHAEVAAMPSPRGETVRYYLDANGRYNGRREVESLLGAAERAGALDRILLFEEPFPEGSDEGLHGLPVRFAADESLHDVADVARKKEQGFSAIALKPAGKTLSLTLAMAAEARRLGLACFVADSACLPRSLDWNKNVAARLAPLPGLDAGLIESNGPENYGRRRWKELLDAHPCAPASWLDSRGGVFRLDESFYASGGGVLDPL